MVDSTGSQPKRKQPKPPKDHPLHVHKGTRYWRKKIRSKDHYFGPVAGDEDGKKARTMAARPSRASDSMERALVPLAPISPIGPWTPGFGPWACVLLLDRPVGLE
jgi:hypothetical protein